MKIKKDLKKAKHVNIYLTLEDKKELNKIKYKYHLSYSTIANILVSELTYPCKLEIIYKYLYEEKNNYKTHIKPRANLEHTEFDRFIYTNAIKIFVRDDLKKLIPDERKIQSIKAKIQRQFEITEEDNWDGNHFNRSMIRWLKRNREYAQKVLDGEK